MKVFPLEWGVSLTDFLTSSLTSEQTLISWFAFILNLCDITTDYLLAICLFLHLNSLYDRCEYFHLKLVRSIWKPCSLNKERPFRFCSRFIRGTKTQHPSVRRENLSTHFTTLTPVDVDKQWKIIRLLKTKKYNTHVLRHIFSIVFLAMALH